MELFNLLVCFSRLWYIQGGNAEWWWGISQHHTVPGFGHVSYKFWLWLYKIQVNNNTNVTWIRIPWAVMWVERFTELRSCWWRNANWRLLVVFSYTKRLKFVQKSLRASRLRSQMQRLIITVRCFFFDLWCVFPVKAFPVWTWTFFTIQHNTLGVY